MQLKIEYKKIKDLIPYEKNARKHQKYDVEQIAKSIEKYGFNDPVGIWSDKNIIVEGHGRVQACKLLGIKEVPCIRLDHLTEKERREYALLHNKTAELSEWDLDLLGEDLDGLDFGGFEIDWGIISPEDFGDGFSLSDSDVPKTRTITLSLSEDQYQIALRVIDAFGNDEVILHDFGNKNKKSNQLFEAVYLWAMQNELL